MVINLSTHYFPSVESPPIKTNGSLSYLQKKHYDKPESSQGSTARWDTPLVRAVNHAKGKPLDRAPAGGRVLGAGPGAIWDTHYFNDDEKWPKRRGNGQVFTQAMLDQINKDVVREANANAQATCKINGQTIFNALKSWLTDGARDDITYEQVAGLVDRAVAVESPSTRQSSPSISPSTMLRPGMSSTPYR